ncbi:MAG: YdiU family protein [Campylobacterales bacterium]|nr:YdiU family protein [Campylobacterales bacterium]
MWIESAPMLMLDCSHLEDLDSRFYHLASIAPLANPKLASFNDALADEMGFEKPKNFIAWHNGELLAEGSTPYAYAYAGHQFGYFVPNLGDGRAINLGAWKTYHLQLKGAGRTQYSRDGDGRAVLRSSIREYLASEAMQGLGILTTRSLSLIASDTPVHRESVEKGAMVIRVSSSWMRFGSFEFAYLGQNKARNIAQLADFVIAQSYPELENKPDSYIQLYQNIVQNTAELIALWQSVGFVHGVMNTDNMSIIGESIDYGPYGFMERFDANFVPNLSDYEGRYAYQNQPFIAQWNLTNLAKVFTHIAQPEAIDVITYDFMKIFKHTYTHKMQQKLGLLEPHKEDRALIKSLLNALQADEVDYTLFFYYLSQNNQERLTQMAKNQLKVWLEAYHHRVENTPLEDRLDLMQHHNPKYILRETMLNSAIAKANEDDFSAIEELLKIVQSPFDAHPKFEHFLTPSPKIYGCSCSS